MAALLWTLAGLGVMALAALMLLGRSSRRIATGRAGRIARMSRVSARLSASWLGARLRRLFASRERRARIDAARRQGDARLLAQTMGQMKGALMKLGQMLSFVSDDIPAEFRAALAQLQAQAPAMDFALLRDVAERELGRPLERAFARFDAEPLAAASIGQVHRAQLPDGQEVVVKIQYPGVAEAITADLANVDLLYRFVALMYPALDPGAVIEELRGRIFEELDYLYEARSQRAFCDLYLDHPFIRIPRVIDSHSTARVLVSEYIPGRSWPEIAAADPATRARFAEILYRFVFGSIIRFGVFNGDPHPGNYLYDSDGRAVFLDFGCVKYFPEPMLANWRALVLAHLAGDRQAFRARLEALGFLARDAGIETEVLYDFFGYFYEPFHEDRRFTFTRAYNARSLRMVFAPEGRFEPMKKHVNMPPDFVFVNRIQWGVYSILAQLEASANWHRIHRELLYGDPPSTELGRIDHEYRARWLGARGLSGVELKLSPRGLERRAAAGAG